jgi:soluble lytic murein transglycosylase-like protein
MRMQSRVALAAALVAASAWCRADIYGYTDADGAIHLADRRPDKRFALLMKEPAVHGRATSTWARALPGALAARPYDEHVSEAARDFNLDPALIHAVMAVESAYNAAAISSKGALGLMQVMPATGLRYGVGRAELVAPATNVRTGARYLADLLRMFEGDVALAVAAYNAGEQAVLRHGRRIPPFPETQAYVPRVLKTYEALRGR